MPEPQSEAAPTEIALGPSRRWVVMSILVALGFVSGIGASQHRPGEPGSELDLVALAAVAPLSLSGEPSLLGEVPAPAPEPSLALGALEGPVRGVTEWTVVTKGELRSGESLGGALRQQGIAPGVVHLITQQVGPHFDFRRSRPGHRYRVVIDSEGRVVGFRYSTSLEESLYLHWDGDAYVLREERAELEPRVAALAGLVDSSLYESIRTLGEDPLLADDFAQIFAWDIDFTRNVKSGDAFRVLYERLYLTDDDGDEIYIRPGRILAARYEGAVGEHSAVYYELEEGRGGYFRPDGTSIEGAFLVAPLRYSRITSRYTNARRHPILNVTRRHPGIDYAAAEGTQLWSVADGTVIYRGWAGASGNLVKVRHANGYVSHYAHLSRFAKGLEVGHEVQQKQVIGYVGRTGLATGAHVCFRVTKNGRYVNPVSIRSPASDSIAADQEVEFGLVRDQLLAGLDFTSIAATDEAL